jgi:3-dehydroquinate dehydratase-1
MQGKNTMRMESEIKVRVRGRIIGGPDTMICLPLVAGEKSEVLDRAGELKRFEPDLIEWRIDHYKNVENIGDSMDVLKALREKIGNIPLVFTCRAHAEGGFKEVREGIRLNLIQAAVESGHIDLADVELCSKPAFIEKVKETAMRFKTRLIFSYHSFDETPEEAFILEKLIKAQDIGADIAKIAVMPKNYKDVLILINATLKARTELLKIPMIAISMGNEGRVSRLAGGLFGSDLTYAVGNMTSAPGQIEIGDLRRAMAVLYT